MSNETANGNNSSQTSSQQQPTQVQQNPTINLIRTVTDSCEKKK